MPRNQRHINRDERYERLVDAATEEFLCMGYADTTMKSIGKRAGVTGANLYWYFPSKDGALVAVQRRVLESTRARLDTQDPNEMQRLQDFLEIFRAEARPLHQMLHERSSNSPEVAEILAEIHTEIESLIRGAVCSRSSSFPDMDTIVKLSMAVIEGTSAVSAPEHSSEMVRWAIERLVPQDSRTAG